MKTDILEYAISHLDYQNGQLFDLSVDIEYQDQENWLNLSDWIAAAKKAGAEKLFFVDNNPVIVFARSGKTVEERNAAFSKLWCLSRPRILFLESDGELFVIDMAQPPVRSEGTGGKNELKTLKTLKAIKSVVSKLQNYHRENIESGKVFEKERFGSLRHRADQALIEDIKVVRNDLIVSGLSCSIAHSLIGRSIFLRYLEDRGILDKSYFYQIADSNPEWFALLDNPCSKDDFDFSGIDACYPRVLQNKEFTFALFRSLSRDFNGDMFPDIDNEETHIDILHLRLIQDLLYGDAGAQRKLFFFSYKFDIIPLDLISSIYEEFYHASSVSDKKSTGAFYTPPILAEFVLSRVLTIDVLEQNPRVLDPACGSGIFLVEAFRRIVRYRISHKKSSLNFDELKQILGQQIVGIEVNDEAARIAAFSLYLAMLHYLDSPSIRRHINTGNKLPSLIASEVKEANQYNCIYVEDAFAIDSKCFPEIDVVVGNPPWGAPQKDAEQIVKDRQKVMVKWCNDNHYTISNKERSQAFLWKAREFVKNNGRCALLTSAGVLFKNSKKSQTFRQEWMKQVCITEVFNFTHVRRFYFRGAISPFVLIQFVNRKQMDTPVEYWSPKQTIAIKSTQAVLMSQYDRAYLIGQNLSDNKTWKIHWFGRHADSVFVKNLGRFRKLEDIVEKSSKGKGRGYQTYTNRVQKNKNIPNKTLEKIISRYEPLSFALTPNEMYNQEPIRVYYGNKIIFNEGISEKHKNTGRILARYEDKDFAFSRAMYGLKLEDDIVTNYELVIGLLWSAFARYYFFNTSANWGIWHHKILFNELMQMPIPAEFDNDVAKRVISIVQQLRIGSSQWLSRHTDKQQLELENKLDDAVFDLFCFSNSERDLITDFCNVTLPFFYKPIDSTSLEPALTNTDVALLQKYAEAFAFRWRPYLNEGEVLRADLHVSASGDLLAMEFFPADIGDNWDLIPKSNLWSHVLDEINMALVHPIGTSQMLIDGIVHVITDESIIVLKRNIKRFWTSSLAREDAETTLSKRMQATIPLENG